MGDDATRVVSLRGNPIQSPGTPDENVIAELERALALARSGEIKGVGVAFVYWDDCANSRYAGWAGRALVGELELLQFRICKALDSEP